MSRNKTERHVSGSSLREIAEAGADLTRLDRWERDYHQAQSRLRHTIAQNEQVIDWNMSDIAALQIALARRTDTSDHRFLMVVAGRVHTSRSSADRALRELLVHELDRPGAPGRLHRAVAELGGLTFDATLYRTARRADYELIISGLPIGPVGGTRDELLVDAASSLPARLENRLGALDRQLAGLHAEIDTCRAEIAGARIELAEPFPHRDELDAARRRIAEIDARSTGAAARPDPVRGRDGGRRARRTDTEGDGGPQCRLSVHPMRVFER